MSTTMCVMGVAAAAAYRAGWPTGADDATAAGAAARGSAVASAIVTLCPSLMWFLPPPARAGKRRGNVTIPRGHGLRLPHHDVNPAGSPLRPNAIVAWLAAGAPGS